MNIGEYEEGTPEHEIGHALGLYHEHQNPNAGITFDKDAVIAYYAKPPNKWNDLTTRENILDPIDPDCKGSNWDAKSIMHYDFAPGLILTPEWAQKGTPINTFLSEEDKLWAKRTYPHYSSKLLLNPGKNLISESGIHTFRYQQGKLQFQFKHEEIDVTFFKDYDCIIPTPIKCKEILNLQIEHGFTDFIFSITLTTQQAQLDIFVID